MNDQKIFALMASKPDLTALQIADHFVTRLRDASEAMRGLVESGDVVRSKSIGADQQSVMVYNLSDQFRASKEGQALLVEAVTEPVNLGHGDGSVPNPRVVAEAVKLPAASVRKPASAAARGVDIIIRRGRISNTDLAVEMGLSKGQYPSAYLATAVSAGKVHHLSGSWSPGRAPGAAPPDRRAVDVGIQGRTVGEVLPAPSGLPADAPLADLVGNSASSVFRCGLWSDGVIELQRDGVMVAQLVQREGEQLACFIHRMLAVTTAKSETGAQCE